MAFLQCEILRRFVKNILVFEHPILENRPPRECEPWVCTVFMKTTFKKPEGNCANPIRAWKELKILNGEDSQIRGVGSHPVLGSKRAKNAHAQK